MMRYLTIMLLSLVLTPFADAQEAIDAPANAEGAAAQEQPADNLLTDDMANNLADDLAIENGDGIESPKTMSGMSILGNEEAPKSLVIVPWKSSKLGDDINLSDTLDDRAQPVDKEVFLRELRFYELRSNERT